MRRILRARFLASALVVGSFVAAAVPAQAQVRVVASFDNFHNQLARHGDWVYSDRWGMVWQPADVPDDFRPYYTGGRWAYTGAYGWTWASDYDWGDIAFHYGRWVNDPYDGWMWLPGYTWSPGWVIWRSNAQSVGWMAMPPDNQFLGSEDDNYFAMSFGGISLNWNDTSANYGYSRWYGKAYNSRRFASNWTFIDTGRLADRDYSHVAYTPDRAITSIRQTTNITNYKIENKYMVNRSIDARTVERASGRPIVAVAPAMVFRHPDTVMTIDASQKTRGREFDHAPHGTGLANSAPPPPPTIIDKLSDRAPARHANGGMPDAGPRAAGGPPHLFTRSTITAPAVANQFRGKLRPGAMNTPAGALPPSGSQRLHQVPPAAAPASPKPALGTMTGPRPGEIAPRGKMHEPLPVGPGPVTPPNAGPVGAPAGRPFGGQGHPFEHKPLPAVTSPSAAEPVVKPGVTPMANPPEHKMMHPMMRPVAEPVGKPLTEPVPKASEHQAVPPPPVVHTPPAVESAPPPRKPDSGKDDRMKGEHANKNEHNQPN